MAVCALVNIRGEIDPYPWAHPDRAHIQFITPSSMVEAGPRWAHQMNSSNEAAKATPQTTTMFSASTLTWTRGETVLAIAAICDLPFQPQESKLTWHRYLIQCAESEGCHLSLDKSARGPREAAAKRR